MSELLPLSLPIDLTVLVNKAVDAAQREADLPSVEDFVAYVPGDEESSRRLMKESGRRFEDNVVRSAMSIHSKETSRPLGNVNLMLEPTYNYEGDESSEHAGVNLRTSCTVYIPHLAISDDSYLQILVEAGLNPKRKVLPGIDCEGLDPGYLEYLEKDHIEFDVYDSEGHHFEFTAFGISYGEAGEMGVIQTASFDLETDHMPANNQEQVGLVIGQINSLLSHISNLIESALGEAIEFKSNVGDD